MQKNERIGPVFHQKIMGLSCQHYDNHIQSYFRAEAVDSHLKNKNQLETNCKQQN